MPRPKQNTEAKTPSGERDEILPAAGGTYLRDPDTGELTPADEEGNPLPPADAPAAGDA